MSLTRLAFPAVVVMSLLSACASLDIACGHVLHPDPMP